MKKMFDIPEGVKVQIDGMKVSVSGKNNLERNFYDQMFSGLIKIEEKDGKIIVSSESEKRRVKAFVGTVTSHIKNMVKGAQADYTYKLKICYVHFPMTVKVDKNQVLITNFLGEKKPRISEILDGVKVQVKKDDITVTSSNKENAGQTAANIETATKITARDRRVYQDGIFITEKAR